ncbi:hypothetical protein ACP70R_037784 [Stipagrostis hirtigluma subsp. patula]
MRRGLDGFVVVGTNLIHAYAPVSELASARAVWDAGSEHGHLGMRCPMLNGYMKAGMMDMSAELFWSILEWDVVSWSTMLHGYIHVDCFPEAPKAYIKVGDLDTNGSEVLLVDFVKVCARHSAVAQVQQLHMVTLKNGFGAHSFVQASSINFYGCCGHIGLDQMQFRLSDKSHVASWNALMAGLLRGDPMDESRQLFDGMPERDMISWSTLISGCVQVGHPVMALQLFCSMMSAGVEPNEITLASVLSAVADAHWTKGDGSMTT